MKALSWLSAALLLAVIVSPVHASLFLVVPNAQTSTLGNDISGNLSAIPGVSLEFQEVFGRGQFSSVPGSMLITQFAYRLKPGTGSITSSVTSASVYMSTSPYAPNSFPGNTLITPTFATNLGPDNTLVLSSGPGTLWSSPGCTALVTCPFDIVYTLTTPFLYDPTKGFLLIDIHVNGYNGVGNGEFDVQSFLASATGGSVASVNSFALGSPTGNVEFSGNIVQFGYTLTPEPASWAVILGGLGALAAIRRRRRS